MRAHSLVRLVLAVSFLVIQAPADCEAAGSGDRLTLIDELDAGVCYARADDLYNQGKYEEADAYYNRAREIWVQEVSGIRVRMDEIRLNLTDISQQQEDLNRTYVQNETRYSSQQMMENALMDTTEALVTEFIPVDMFPHPADEIVEGAQTVESIPGVVDTLQNTRNALIWNSQGRNQNRDVWKGLENLRMERLEEYKAADLEAQRISALIESAQLGMSRATEAMQGST